MGDAYFGFYLLAMGQGRPRTAERLRALLLEAGFARVQTRDTRRPLLCRLMLAEIV
jgi:demethylspheroidene O-methyltransferase